MDKEDKNKVENREMLRVMKIRKIMRKEMEVIE
jgi:hypothetical protein